MDDKLYNAFRVPAIDTQTLYIDGKEVDLQGGAKAASVSPLKAGADTDAIVKKVNEVITALKVAGIMENK